MSTSFTDFKGFSSIGYSWGKQYHWTFSRRGCLLLHRGGVESKCKRIHHNQRGDKQ